MQYNTQFGNKPFPSSPLKSSKPSQRTGTWTSEDKREAARIQALNWKINDRDNTISLEDSRSKLGHNLAWLKSKIQEQKQVRTFNQNLELSTGTIIDKIGYFLGKVLKKDPIQMRVEALKELQTETQRLLKNYK